MSDVTRLLDAAAAGDRRAAADLLPLVYDELRKLAAARMAAEPPGQTLQPTALVHEAYLRLVGDQHFDGRGHFFAAAAEAMRRVLVERAQRKKLPKHGGGRRVELNEAHRVLESSDDLLLLDEALGRLSAEDATAVEIVKLRLFAGLSVEEAAMRQRVEALLRAHDDPGAFLSEAKPGASDEIESGRFFDGIREQSRRKRRSFRWGARALFALAERPRL
jgi:RNA polymerase sigma factor (TIGR02999 family)